EQLEDRTLLAVLPPADLVSWWRAENNAADFTGSNNGILQNGTTFATGMVGQAFNLDGNDDFVDVPDSASLDAISSAITVEAWIKPEVPVLSGEGRIFARRDPFIREGFSVEVTGSGALLINVRTASAGEQGSSFVTANGV